MARPREFDRDDAIELARQLFWDQGYAATTTEDLRKAMGIGRQSFYGAFGGKREVFVEALEVYVEARFGMASGALEAAESPFAGIERLFSGLLEETDAERARGCLGVASVCELGSADPDVKRITARAQARTIGLLRDALARAKERREIKSTLDPEAVAQQLHATFIGLRVMSRGGASVEMLRAVAATTLGSLRRSPS